MSPWYRKSFGRHYLDIYPHRDDREARTDIRNVIELIRPLKNAPLLDLACGAGRHLIALHELGFTSVFGLDLSKDLLKEAAKNMRKIGVPQVELYHSDMRHIPKADFFSTILSLFTSFGYFEEDFENEDVIQTVYRSLREGGVFLVDTLHKRNLISTLVLEDERTINGLRIRSERRLINGERRVEKTTRIKGPGGEEREFHESVRLFTPEEMEGMLRSAGFQRIRKYGSLLGEPLSPQSRRLVLVGEKHAEQG